jgi:hypothetical protein
MSTMKRAIKRQVLTAVAELGIFLVDELTAAEITEDHRQLLAEPVLVAMIDYFAHLIVERYFFTQLGRLLIIS